MAGVLPIINMVQVCIQVFAYLGFIAIKINHFYFILRLANINKNKTI